MARRHEILAVMIDCKQAQTDDPWYNQTNDKSPELLQTARGTATKERLVTMSDSTTRRNDVYKAIVEYASAHGGNSPSYRELLKLCNQRGFNMCLSVLRAHVDRLESDGSLFKKDGYLCIVGARWEPPVQRVIVKPPIKEPVIAKTPSRKQNASKIRAIYKSQKGLCWWCEGELLGIFEVDHRVPPDKGGSNDWDNLCLSCPDCNRIKSNKLPQDFNGRLL